MHCPSCREDNPPGARFCMACGTRLDGHVTPTRDAPATLRDYTPSHLADGALSAPGALAGERKPVTVLFCDMVESTRLAATLGAEDMHVLLSDLFRRAMAEVHRLEGTVNQFLGDGFMALFGAPLAHEDHAARAALAALAIREAVAQARAEASLPGWAELHVRMGMNSGEVVVGAIGDAWRTDYTASGDTTHLAARLQQAAAADEILLSAATREAAREVLEVSSRGTLLMKGVARPVSAWRLDGVQARATRAGARGGPFLGREQELASLLSHGNGTVAGRGGVLEVVGEPGAGKSRLVAEFLAATPSTIRVAAGQCITYGAQRPNLPVMELAQALLGLEGAAPTGDDATLLAAFTGDAVARAALGEIDPATLRGRTQQALAGLVQRRAGEGPLVLVVEDLHWADASSLDHLATVAAAASSGGALLIVTSRPGAPSPWPPQQVIERLLLAPLDEQASRNLLTSLMATAGLDHAAGAVILARAEGNPFFLEELVRTAGHGLDSVPGDVSAVLAARIDRLAAEDKAVLRRAAVLGRRFPLPLLDALATDGADRHARLDRLAAFGFIEPAAQPGQYQFVHALTWEVTYQGMLAGERRQRHGAVAEHLVAQVADSDALCEDIARHFLASDAPERALPWLEAATAKAIREHNLEAAYARLREVLERFAAAPSSPEQSAHAVGFLLQSFPVFHFLHRHGEYAALLEVYRDDVDAIASPALSGAYYAQLGHRQWVAGRYREAPGTLRRALDYCAASGDVVNAAHAALMLCWSLANGGDCARGEASGQVALGYLEQVPVPLLRTFNYVGLCLTAAYRGRSADARRYATLARDVGLAAGDDGLAAFGGSFIAYACYEDGDGAGGVAAAEAAMAIAPTDYFRGWAAAFLAAARLALGDAAGSAPVLAAVVEFSRAAGHSGHLLIAVPLLEALLAAGEHERACREAAQFRAAALAAPYPYVAAATLDVMATDELRRGRAAEAVALFAAAREEFLAIDARHRAAAAACGLGRAYLALGERDAARTAITAALAEYETLGAVARAARTRELLSAG